MPSSENNNIEAARQLYEQGNALRRQQRWGDALNAYSEAVALDPDSPARHAREMLVQIMEYRCKDYYNP